MQMRHCVFIIPSHICVYRRLLAFISRCLICLQFSSKMFIEEKISLNQRNNMIKSHNIFHVVQNRVEINIQYFSIRIKYTWNLDNYGINYFNVKFFHVLFKRTFVCAHVNLTSWLSELQSEMHPFSNNMHATIAWITPAKR